jgi:hypothetical protein
MTGLCRNRAVDVQCHHSVRAGLQTVKPNTMLVQMSCSMWTINAILDANLGGGVWHRVDMANTIP